MLAERACQMCVALAPPLPGVGVVFGGVLLLVEAAEP